MISLLKEFELAFGELPNEPEGNQVIYVDNGLNPDLTLFMEHKLDIVKRIFGNYGLKFIYLKDWIKGVSDTDLSNIAKYYLPWVQPDDIDTLRNAFAINIEELEEKLVPKDAAGAVIGSKRQAFKIDVSKPFLYEEQFRQIAEAYSRYNRATYPYPTLYELEIGESAQICRDEGVILYQPQSTPGTNDDIDTSTDDEITTLFKKVRGLLPEWAVKQMLLDKLQQQEVISRIWITHRRTIELPDYNISIRLRPVEMAFYILFLKHPEGINFKDLIDYRDELMGYYSHYAANSNPDDMRKAIDSVVNPLNDSNRNIQRSRIQKAINDAFRNQFCEAYASHYMITGARAEDKKITLPREKVVWFIDL